MKVEEFRKQFPGLEQQCYGNKLVYLDNAATSQRCISAMELLQRVSYNYNANVHRSVYKLASEATKIYEDTRDYVQKYINAKSREEIIFTSGTTFSINLVARTYGEKFVGKGDNIIIGESEHHSNIVPWQLLCEKTGAEIRVLPIAESGEYDVNALSTLMDEHTKLVCVAQISNVLGVLNPIEDIVRLAHGKNIKVMVDGAQGAVHLNTDVQKMDCDFYAFSGHKMFASTGTGVLYAKKELLEVMPPFLGGGEMIGTVTFKKTTYAELPYKFEAGTPNFNVIPTLKEGMSLLGYASEDRDLVDNLERINEYVYDALCSDERITLLGSKAGVRKRIPLYSIIVKGVHHEDMAVLMDKMGVALRSGHVCAEPLMDRFGVTGILRASFAPYNTIQEAEYFIKCLNRSIEMLL